MTFFRAFVIYLFYFCGFIKKHHPIKSAFLKTYIQVLNISREIFIYIYGQCDAALCCSLEIVVP